MRKSIFVLLAVVLVIGLVPMAVASTSVTCRTGVGCLNGTDHFDWGTNFGAQYTIINNGSTATSVGGVTGIISFETGGNGARLDQFPPGQFEGNFTPGDKLIWTRPVNGPANGPLTITFGTPLSGAGANIQPDFYAPFTAQICDNFGNCFSEAGSSNADHDGSAIFIGLANDPGITSVTFSIIGGCLPGLDCADFFINQLDIVPEAPAVPEPTSMILVGTGLLGLGGAVRRRFLSRP